LISGRRPNGTSIMIAVWDLTRLHGGFRVCGLGFRI
jgi:hypothetical protein